jgi:hypothetical protein
VNILRALVNCDGEAIINNQAEISKEKHGLLIEDEEANKVLLLVKERGEEIQICVYDIWLPLQDFESRSKDDDKGRLFKYFCAIINLCADLCLDRNLTAIIPL